MELFEPPNLGNNYASGIIAAVGQMNSCELAKQAMIKQNTKHYEDLMRRNERFALSVIKDCFAKP